MKFSTVAYTIFGAALFFASKAVADVDYFDWPYPNAVFHSGASIQFVVDEMPSGDDHDRVYAKLFRENGSFVKTIRSWYNNDWDDDEFAFSWSIDRNLSSGRYFVEISSDDDDDISRSFIFELDSNGDNNDSDGDNNDSDHDTNDRDCDTADGDRDTDDRDCNDGQNNGRTNRKGSNGNSRGARGNSRGARGHSRGARGNQN